MRARAAELGYAALAITDECSLAGVVRAWSALRELAAHLPAIGSLTLTPDVLTGALAALGVEL